MERSAYNHAVAVHVDEVQVGRLEHEIRREVRNIRRRDDQGVGEAGEAVRAEA